jgi:hypothetical protein
VAPVVHQPEPRYTAPPQGPPAARPEDPFDFQDQEPYPRYGDELDFSQQREARQWMKVQTGIGLILASIFTLIGLFVVLFCGGMFLGMMATQGAAGAGRGRPEDVAPALGGALVLAGLVILGGLTAFILQITGQVYCVAAPARNSAKGLAVTSLVLTLLALFLNLAGYAWLFMGGVGAAARANPVGLGAAAGGGNVLTASSSLVQFVQFIVFLFFLRAVALSVRAYGVAQGVIYLLILGGIMIALFVAIIVLIVAAGVGQLGKQGGADLMAAVGTMGIAGMCVEIVLAISFFIFYIVTLFQVRGAIFTFARRRPSY